MLRLILVTLFCLLCVGANDNVSARPGHGGAPFVATNGPVLASTSNLFGNRTPSTRGGERLSRTNQNYGAKYSPYGTGILVSGSCAKWSTAQIGGTAGHFNVISHVAEGITAVTPTPTASGVTAQLNGGPYTFLVSCEDSSNNVLATSTLTYPIYSGDNNCGAVNLGSTDNTGSGVVPSGFGNTIDGCYVLMSVGFYKTGRFILGMPFTHRTTVTFADPSRPGELQNIELGSNSTHSSLKNIMVLGAHTDGLGAAAAFVLGGTDSIGENLHRYATATMRALGSYGCIQTPSALGGTVTNFGCEWVGGFFTVQSNWTYQYGWSRFASADAIITGNGNPNHFHLKDITIMSMKQPVTNHPDVFQISDGSTPSDYSVERIMAISAAGDVLFQGPFFGGGISGVPTSSAPDGFFGYVDDGTTAHGPGNLLTVTTGGGMQSNATGSLIYSTSGGAIGISSGVTANCGATPCLFGAKFTGTGVGTNLTVSGIPPSPGSIMVLRVGYVLRGIGVPDGTRIVSQTSGISGKDGVYVTSNSTTSAAAALTAGPQYTLTGFSGNYATYASPAQFYGVENVNATWDMVWNSGDVIQGMFYSGSSGTSSATHFTHMREITPGVTGIGPPRLRFQNCQFPVYTGALTISKGAEYSQWDSDCTPSSSAPPSTVVTNVFNAAQNTATLASWYVNGDPKPCLEAKSIAQWDALTIQQSMVFAASCTIPNLGGSLDLGTDVANAIGTDLTPTWADGTVVGTGFNGQ